MKLNMTDKVLHGLDAISLNSLLLPPHPALLFQSTGIGPDSILSTSQVLLISGPLHMLPILSGMLFLPYSPR